MKSRNFNLKPRSSSKFAVLCVKSPRLRLPAFLVHVPCLLASGLRRPLYCFPINEKDEVFSARVLMVPGYVSYVVLVYQISFWISSIHKKLNLWHLLTALKVVPLRPPASPSTCSKRPCPWALSITWAKVAWHKSPSLPLGTFAYLENVKTCQDPLNNKVINSKICQWERLFPTILSQTALLGSLPIAHNISHHQATSGEGMKFWVAVEHPSFLSTNVPFMNPKCSEPA